MADEIDIDKRVDSWLFSVNEFLSQKRKQKEEQKEKEYLEKYVRKPIEVGDLVHKNYRNCSKYATRVGRVVRLSSYSQAVVLWSNSGTPVYERNSDLKILRPDKQKKFFNERQKFYSVISLGTTNCPQLFETYEEASEEAERLVIKLGCPAYVLETIACYEMPKTKVKKFK